MRVVGGAVLVTLAGLALLPAIAEAQDHSLGVNGVYQGYSFDEALEVDAADLVVIPLAYRLPVGETFLFDFYTAWASGRVEREGRTFRLDGMLDTQAKVSWRPTPWAVISIATNLPTGRESHTAEETVVAALFSSDLLGFRAASWGSAPSVTTGISAATRIGVWGVGIGASTRQVGSFEPSADTALIYEPGDELRFRLAIDRNVGESGKLSGGITFQNFSHDQLEDRNLFQPGERISGEVVFNDRIGSVPWTAWLMHSWREHGDLLLQTFGSNGQIVGDSAVATPSQQLTRGGMTGSFTLSQTTNLRPVFDFRWISRDDPARNDVGSGWMVGVGADLPWSVTSSLTVTPSIGVKTGSVLDQAAQGRRISGGHAGVSMRWLWR